MYCKKSDDHYFDVIQNQKFQPQVLIFLYNFDPGILSIPPAIDPPDSLPRDR